MGKIKKVISALKKEEKAAREEVSAEDSIKKAMLNLNQNMSSAPRFPLRNFSTNWLPIPKR